MFKKLLSLAALAVIGMSAYADEKVDWVKDYTVDTWNYYVMGYIPSQENGYLTVTQTRGSWERVDGEAVYTPNDDKDGDGQPDVSWYQLFVGDGIPTQIGETYTVTIYGKADVEATANMNMQWGWGEGQSISNNVAFTTEWSEIPVEYKEVGGSSCALVLQPGVQETTFEIQWIKVSHFDNSKPVEWIELLEGGDAENGEAACAVGKIYGNGDAGICPCAVEEVDAAHGKAFVLHATAMSEFAWDNQFWIVAPNNWKEGDSFLLSFEYKAAAAAKVTTQYHAAPGAYQHWAAIGDINFTTDWQTFTKEITIPKEANNGYSIAFNLNEYVDANDYYFDNISLKAMKLDEGWFVATDKNDVDNAVAMHWNADEELYEVCVGTEENPASVIMISTKRGNRTAFNSNCIKVAGEILDGEFMEYVKGYGTITLPEPGIWTVQIDPEAEQIAFTLGDVTDPYAWEDDTTGIASVEVEEAAPIYYNLQGVQVINPTKGNIYIVKKGNKVSKVIR